MTDAEQRRLRRLAAAGDPQAEVAWLRSRVRTGDLGAGQVRLAAYLGYPPAARACGEAPRSPSELRGWVRGLGRFSKEACVRAAVVAAELVVTEDEVWGYPGQALQAAQAWIACPCRTCADQAEEAIGDWQVAVTRRERAAIDAARSAAGVLHPPQEPQFRKVFSASRRASRAVRSAASAVGEQSVRAAIQAALIPWALGREPRITLEQKTGVSRPLPTPDRAALARARWSERILRDARDQRERVSSAAGWEEPNGALLLVGLGVFSEVVRILLDVLR